jgi:hypothetical protein
VGRPITQGLRRAIAFAVVVGLHGLAITLMVALRNPPLHSRPNDFVSTVTLLFALPPPAGPSTQLHFKTASDASPLAAVEPPIALPAKVSPSGDARRAVDWPSEAQQAAAAVTLTPNVRAFGAGPEVDSARTGALPLPGHAPGAQYRTTDGVWVVWVSDRCYLVSEVPPIGLPEVLARSIPTRTVCQGDAESRGDLFKDLPAYEKHHPH